MGIPLALGLSPNDRSQETDLQSRQWQGLLVWRSSAVVDDDVLRAAAVQARTGHTLAVLENLYLQDRSIIRIE